MKIVAALTNQNSFLFDTFRGLSLIWTFFIFMFIMPDPSFCFTRSVLFSYTRKLFLILLTSRIFTTVPNYIFLSYIILLNIILYLIQYLI